MTQTTPTFAHRLALRLHNLWRYRLWSACAHRWTLTLDAQGFAQWRCGDCRARQ